MLSKAGEIRRDEACLDYAGHDVMLYPCHGSKGNQVSLEYIYSRVFCSFITCYPTLRYFLSPSSSIYVKTFYGWKEIKINFIFLIFCMNLWIMFEFVTRFLYTTRIFQTINNVIRNVHESRQPSSIREKTIYRKLYLKTLPYKLYVKTFL